MKRILSTVLAVFMLVGMLGITAFAGESSLSANVYVTISDKDGNLALTQEKITVTDIDNDNQLTINDTLYCAHEAKYKGGAAAGYASSFGANGLSMTKLWGAGTESGYGYGYYVNNASAWNLSDTVKEDDYVNAFVYTDLIAWSDTFCFFDANSKNATAGDEIVLTLSALEYDAEWNPITVPIANATILINGNATEYKTDDDGKVTIQLENVGDAIISAASIDKTLVPPVCKVTVSAQTPSNTDNNSLTDNNTTETPFDENNNAWKWIVMAAIAVVGIVVIVFVAIKKKSNEK